MNRHLLILYGILAVLVAVVLVLILRITTENPRDGQSAEGNVLSSQGLARREQQSRQKTSSQSCPRKQFVTGIKASGAIICSEIVTISQSRGESIADNKPECYDHGFIEHGFCTCDEEWTGPECQDPRPIPSGEVLPDEDNDNVPAPLDCDDNDDLVYPGAPDSVDGKDNDCDGIIDEGY